MNSIAATVTVKSTILITAFVTARPTVTTTVIQFGFTNPDDISLSQSSSSDAASSPPAQTTSEVVLPTIVPGPSSTSSIANLGGSINTSTPLATESSTPNASNVSVPVSHTTQKAAVIGGLAGSIAGCFFIGVLVFLAMRHRRKRVDSEDHSFVEKGLRPSPSRAWTDAWTDLLSRTSSTRTHPSPQVSVDEHHHIIRMSLHNWARPYAEGKGEGMRDSMGPQRSQLRVTNPDPPRPWTPGQASTPAASILTRASRSALATFLHGHRARTNSGATTASPSRQSNIVHDGNWSAECSIRRPPHATSFSTRSSMTTMPRHEDLDDPFITPVSEKSEPEHFNSQTPQQSTLAPTHNLARRTINHVGPFFRSVQPSGNRLTPSPFGPSPGEPPPSSRRLTGYSDPFDLDRSSVSDFEHSTGPHDRDEHVTTPRWAVVR